MLACTSVLSRLSLPAGGGCPRFDALVVDEAAQALEPATIIPFTLLHPHAKVKHPPSFPA